MDENDDILREFVAESGEALDGLDRDLLALETHPGDAELVAAIFRSLHSLKGTCACLGFGGLERLAHTGESVLARVREGSLAPDGDVVSALLALVDALRSVLDTIASSKTEDPGRHADVLARLTELRDRSAAGAASAGATPEPAGAAPAVPAADGADTGGLGEIIVRRGLASREEVDSAREAQRQGDARRLGEILVSRGVIRASDVVDALRRQGEARDRSIADGTLRVDVQLMDRLMNLAGELLLVRNHLLQRFAELGDAEARAALSRLCSVASEIEYGVMKARLQPIGSLWERFPRLVHDLGSVSGKLIETIAEGAGTALDRSILERVRDPLTHIVRNACDHGIETPEVRRAAGKPEIGRIRLSALQEGGRVVIEVSDDGAGIDLERVRRRAVEKGLIPADRAAILPDGDILEIVFLPGFTTSDHVTAQSGRGVGMDVVRTNIEKIGGTAEVESRRGAGTTVRITIPLSLSILPAVIVRAGRWRYAIPRAMVQDIVPVDRLRGGPAVETVDGLEILRAGGRAIPFARLDRLAGGESGAAGTPPSRVVVIRGSGITFGIAVDEVVSADDIIVKALPPGLQTVAICSGATILGDGAVALILDPFAMARNQGLQSVRSSPSAAAGPGATGGSGATERLLVCAAAGGRRVAVPMAAVERIERIPRVRIVETVRGPAVRQGDAVLDVLCDVRSAGAGKATGGEDAHGVIIAQGDERAVILVDDVLDTLDARGVVHRRREMPGIAGVVVTEDGAADVLDIVALLDRAAAERDLRIPFGARP